MAVNIYKSYIWTADKDVNMKAIFTVMNTTLSSSEKKAWKKFRLVRDLKPWPLRYRCSVLPTELTSQLGAGHCVGSKINPWSGEKTAVNICKSRSWTADKDVKIQYFSLLLK